MNSKILNTNNVGISTINICGVINPKLTLIGISKFEHNKFKIVVNNKDAEYKDLFTSKKGDFIIESNLGKNPKKIKIFIYNEQNKKFELIHFGRTSFIRRLAKNSIINFKNIFKHKIFYTNTNVGISDVSIDGIMNPLVTIVGSSKYRYNKFKFINNETELEYQNLPCPNIDSFIVTCELNNRNKPVDIYIYDTFEKEYLKILKLKTNIINRSFTKIKKIIKRYIMIIFRFFRVIYRGIRYLWREYHFIVPFKIWKKLFNDFRRSMHYNLSFFNPNIITDYNKWLNKNEKIEIDNIEKFKYNPLISIIIPVYNAKKDILKECIESVLNQSYNNFEICITDDKSTNQETLDCLSELSKLDKRIKIKYRKINGNISVASNDSIKNATGEFIGLLDNDDTLSPNALYEVVKVLNKNHDLDFIYSDEDKLSLNGKRCFPNFKPDFSPDTLLGLNYICHFSVIRKKIVEKVGGFEIGLEGAQDHDLFLKISEITNKFYHIPKILYHWRMSETSTAMSIKNKDYANDKGLIAVKNALKRRNIKAKVTKDIRSTYYTVEYENDNPLVSIIICTRDYADTLNDCLVSLYKKTTYKNFEIIVVNNGSVEEKTYKLFDKYKNKYKSFRVIDINTEFNYSNLNNVAVSKSKGEYVILLNNDTKIITPDWIEKMVGYASQKHVGAVGVKLLYPDMTVQHAGVIMGLGGVASHAYIGAARDDIGMYGRMSVPYNYASVTAACLMVSKEKFNEVGGLEEKLKVAYNDVDFCLKLFDKGYYNIFLPNVELMHYESKSRGLDTTSEKYQRFLVESKIMYKKWDKYIKNDPMYNKNYSKLGWFLLDRK